MAHEGFWEGPVDAGLWFQIVTALKNKGKGCHYLYDRHPYGRYGRITMQRRRVKSLLFVLRGNLGCDRYNLNPVAHAPELAMRRDARFRAAAGLARIPFST
jgi:hypothetical protein